MSGRAEYERHAAPVGDDPARVGDERPDDVPTDPGAGAAAREAAGRVPDDANADAETEADEAGAPAVAESAAQPGGEVAADPAELAAALDAAQRERDEYLDLLRRERAEFENFRKRVTRERMEALDRGAEAVVSELLGVLDDFDRVLEAAERTEDTQLAKGVEMVHGALRAALAQAGLEPVPGAGAPFDPNWHEAMMQVEADEPVEQPVVFEVLRPGYRFKGRVLRPASVSVAQ